MRMQRERERERERERDASRAGRRSKENTVRSGQGVQQVCKCLYARPETTGVVNYNGSLSANHRSDPRKPELTFDLIC
jgi:hypothetical protein